VVLVEQDLTVQMVAAVVVVLELLNRAIQKQEHR
jgi:hypothetical protein